MQGSQIYLKFTFSNKKLQWHINIYSLTDWDNNDRQQTENAILETTRLSMIGLAKGRVKKPKTSDIVWSFDNPPPYGNFRHIFNLFNCILF